jgi:hypothetical protein
MSPVSFNPRSIRVARDVLGFLIIHDPDLDERMRHALMVAFGHLDRFIEVRQRQPRLEVPRRRGAGPRSW